MNLEFEFVNVLFTSRVRSFVRILSFAVSSASTSFTSVWNETDGSKTVEVCFTRLLVAKSFRFLGSPFVEISLHFKFNVEALLLHQPFPTSCLTLSAKWRTVLLPFLIRLRATT